MASNTFLPILTYRRKYIYCFLLSLFSFHFSYSDNTIRHEAVYPITDRMAYLPGDTISVGGLVWQTFPDSLISRYVIVELFSEKGQLINRKKVRATNNLFELTIPTEYHFSPGRYYLRSYTQWMQNDPPESYPLLPVVIGDLPETEVTFSIPSSIYYYPESGNLVTGHLQQMVFEIRDNRNLPMRIASGLLINSLGDTIQRNIHTNKNGLGILRFVPTKDIFYFLEFPQEENRSVSFQLPLPAEKPALSTTLNRNRIYVRLLTSNDKEKYDLWVWNNGKFHYTEEISYEKEQLIIPITEMSPGLITCLLTDKQGKVIAERLLFKQAELSSFSFSTPDSVYLPGQFIQIPIPDSIQGLIARIVPSFLPEKVNSTNLFASAYFEREVDAPIYNPSFYNNQTQQADIHLLLYTLRNGLYDWEKILNGNYVYSYPKEELLTIKGKAFRESGRPLKNGYVIAIENQRGYTYEGEVDSSGEFIIGVDDFEEGTTFFLQGYNEKHKSNNIKLEIEENQTYPSVMSKLLALQEKNTENEMQIRDVQISYDSKRGFRSYKDLNQEQVVQMPEIWVDARKKAPVLSTEEFYNHTYVGSDIIEKSPDIYSALDRLSGISISALSIYDLDKENGESDTSRGIGKTYKIFSNRGVSSLRMDKERSPGEMIVLVDGQRMDNFYIFEHLDKNEIESIERLTPIQALAYVSGAIDGAIHVRTKRYKEPPFISKGMSYTPKGLSKSEGFNQKDLFLYKGEDKIELTLPDVPGEYEIYIEGITSKNIPFTQKIPFVVSTQITQVQVDDHK